jgi:hypothetical protein
MRQRPIWERALSTSRSYASRNIALHLLRGGAAVAVLAIGIAAMPQIGWWALLAAPIVLWLLRGCPACWFMGLFQTLEMSADRRRIRQQKRGAGNGQ